MRSKDGSTAEFGEYAAIKRICINKVKLQAEKASGAYGTRKEDESDI